MKKIFLTSGIILCMACPAFAALQNGDIDVSNDGKVLYGSDPAADANCSYRTLKAYSGTVAFEPVWDAAQYSVTYNAGTHPNQSYTDNIVTVGTATYNETYSLPANATVTGAPGWTFVGWTESSSPSIVSGVLQNEFIHGQTWTNQGDITLYAAYKANDYKITFSCGSLPENASAEEFDVDNAPADIDVNYMGSYAALTAPAETACKLEGYHFAGWDCENNLDVAGGTYEVVGSTECVATWEQNQINLIWYNSDDASNTTAIDVSGTDAAKCDYDDAITLPSSTPVKGGYVFKGWRVTQVRTEEPEEEEVP